MNRLDMYRLILIHLLCLIILLSSTKEVKANDVPVHAKMNIALGGAQVFTRFAGYHSSEQNYDGAGGLYSNHLTSELTYKNNNCISEAILSSSFTLDAAGLKINTPFFDRQAEVQFSCEQWSVGAGRIYRPTYTARPDVFVDRGSISSSVSAPVRMMGLSGTYRFSKEATIQVTSTLHGGEMATWLTHEGWVLSAALGKEKQEIIKTVNLSRYLKDKAFYWGGIYTQYGDERTIGVQGEKDFAWGSIKMNSMVQRGIWYGQPYRYQQTDLSISKKIAVVKELEIGCVLTHQTYGDRVVPYFQYLKSF
jgi:hypothetical protein